jgi:Tol biopolymer transport system component
VRWSPDGKRLLFAESNSPVGKPAGGRALFIINSDGTGRRQLTPWKVGTAGFADWSAAGDRIVVSIHADGSSLRQVTHFSNTVISHQVGFSPDGHWIVFGKLDDKSGVNQVFVARANDGTDMRQLTHSATASSSPDWTS